MNSFVVLSALIGASMAAPQLLAGHGLLGAGYAGYAGHGLLGAGYGHAVAAAPVAVAAAAPVAVAHAAPVAVAHHAVAPVVAVPTATVHRTVQTHLVPQTRLVGHQVHQQVHHVPKVHVETKTSSHVTHHVINHPPVVGAYAGHALPAGIIAGAVAPAAAVAAVDAE